MTGDGGPTEHLVDSRGRRCPLPVIDLARRLATVPVGDVVRLLADDPAAGPDVAAWCRLRGQDLLGSDDPPGPGGTSPADGSAGAHGDGTLVLRVRRRQ